MSSLKDLLDNTLSSTPPAKKKYSKRKSEELSIRISLANQTRDPEKVKEIMSKLGKKPKRMTAKRLRNLKEQQKTLSTREDNSRGGKKAMSNPLNRRKSMRKFKCYVNLTDEEFEERMKILDKKMEERARLEAEQQQTSD